MLSARLVISLTDCITTVMLCGYHHDGNASHLHTCSHKILTRVAAGPGVNSAFQAHHPIPHHTISSHHHHSTTAACLISNQHPAKQLSTTSACNSVGQSTLCTWHAFVLLFTHHSQPQPSASTYPIDFLQVMHHHSCRCGTHIAREDHLLSRAAAHLPAQLQVALSCVSRYTKHCCHLSLMTTPATYHHLFNKRTTDSTPAWWLPAWLVAAGLVAAQRHRGRSVAPGMFVTERHVKQRNLDLLRHILQITRTTCGT